MTASRETLMAYLDGELSAEEERRVAAEIAANPLLNAYVEEQRAVKARLDADFAPILSAPVPERFERMVMEARVPRRAAQRNFFSLTLPRIWLPAGAAAAGIAIGIGLSNLFGGPAMMASNNGALIATGSLARILSTELAAEQGATATTRVGLSFLNRQEKFCRTFQTASGGNALAGIACREGNDWRIIATAASETQNASAFQQAASPLPKTLREEVNDMISGQPLNAAAERTARTNNWTH